MLGALMILLLEIAMAYGAMDLVLRVIPVEPNHLRLALRRYRWVYTCAGLLTTAAGIGAQWRLAGWPGALLGILGLLPWWAFWRLGLHKQLPFLFIPEGRPPQNQPSGQ